MKQKSKQILSQVCSLIFCFLAFYFLSTVNAICNDMNQDFWREAEKRGQAIELHDIIENKQEDDAEIDANALVNQQLKDSGTMPESKGNDAIQNTEEKVETDKKEDRESSRDLNIQNASEASKNMDDITTAYKSDVSDTELEKKEKIHTKEPENHKKLDLLLRPKKEELSTGAAVSTDINLLIGMQPQNNTSNSESHDNVEPKAQCDSTKSDEITEIKQEEESTIDAEKEEVIAPSAIKQKEETNSIITDKKESGKKEELINQQVDDDITTAIAPPVEEAVIKKDDASKDIEKKIDAKKNISRENQPAKKNIAIKENKKTVSSTFTISPDDIKMAEMLDQELEYRKIYDYKSKVLPPSIYKKSYGDQNNHLPKAVYKNEYNAFLFAAIKDDDIGGIKSLLDRGANINIADYGTPPLCYAILHGKTKSVKYLIMKGADINHANSDGTTPLHLAIKTNNIEIVKMLMQAKAHLFNRDKNGLIPYNYIGKKSYATILPIIVESYQDINKALLDFSKFNIRNGVKYCILHGANVNSQDANGDTALILAIINQDIELVSILLANGSDFEIKNAKHRNAVAVAYSYNNPEIIEILETVKIQKELGKLESKNTEEGTQSGFLYDINNYPSQTYLTISAINETS